MKYIIALIAIAVVGCKGPGNKYSDTPTSGSIRIAVDESLRPLIDAEITAFEGIYRQASITPVYVSELEAVTMLINDSVRLAIITRELTAGEKKKIADQKISPHASKVAREGVALIVNRDNPDTLWDMPKLEYLLGEGDANVRVVFDDQGSGIVRYVRDSLLHTRKMPGNSYAAETEEAVIDYVSKDPKAIGLIGASWISDRDDSLSNQFLKSIKVVAIENDDEYYQPYQAYIAQRLYRLTRDVIVNSREPRSGLGTGFTSFVAGDKGQRIVLKAGLVPMTMPVRLVEVSHQQF